MLRAAQATATDESPEALTDALMTALRLLMAISARSIARVDESITIPQFRTMVILADRGPVNLAMLAGLLGVQPSTTGRMVDRLVAGGPDRTQAAPDLSARADRRADVART